MNGSEKTMKSLGVCFLADGFFGYKSSQFIIRSVY